MSEHTNNLPVKSQNICANTTELSKLDKLKIDCFTDSIVITMLKCGDLKNKDEANICLLESIRKFEKCCKDS